MTAFRFFSTCFALVILNAQASVAQVVLPTPEQFFFGLQPQVRRPAPAPPVELSEAKKRTIVVPFIQALTACIVDHAATDDDAAAAYKDGRFNAYAQSLVRLCPDQTTALVDRYDEIYGRGFAYDFIHGPYTEDLPRAVLSKIASRLKAKVAELDRAQAVAQAAADAKAAKDFREAKAEEERQKSIAEREAEERKTALAKAEAERKTAEAQRIAAETKAAAERRDQIDVAKRTFSLIRDKFYDCVDGQLPGLVKSGEGADILANAAMTICRTPMAQLQDSALDEFAIEQGERPVGLAEVNFRDRIKGTVKDRVVADAVQAKAGVGLFAPK